MSKILSEVNCEVIKCSILIIYSDDYFSLKLQKKLEDDNYEVDFVNNLEDAYKLFEERRFDYIILDLSLSDGEEYELIENIPKKMNSRMIVIAQDEDVQRREHLFSLGILDYFFKDTPLDLMIMNIRTLICKVEENHFSHILLIEESIFSRRLLRNILERRGYIVYTASSAKESFEIMERESIQMILVSYDITDMDGISIIKNIKSNPRFLDIPTIMLSSNYEKDIVSRTLKSGAVDFIRKPLLYEEFLLKCDFHTANYLNMEIMRTQKERLDAIIAKMKIIEKNKSEFLANMSHEIRTPLNAIMGFIHLLEDENLSEDGRVYIKTIDYASKNLLRIVNDILDFSKIESGRIDIEEIGFDIRENCNNVVNLFTARASEKNITIELNVDKAVPEFIKTDPFRLRQVVSNLLSNAIKFSPTGSKIVVSVSYKDEKLHIEIIDYGIGIDKSKFDQIFEAFKQEKSSTSREYGGTGLGLAISARLIRLLGGELKLESEVGKYTKFYFEIPVKIAEKQVKKKPNLKSLNIKDKKILIAEDNSVNQMFMKSLFGKLVNDFDIAGNGIEVLEFFNNKKYDLILMDENMPKMDGIEATKKIREIEKEKNLKHTPIVALTGNALRGEREKVLEIGMDDYMTKPIDLERLTEILYKFLG